MVDLAEDNDAREARFRVVRDLRVEEEDAFVRSGWLVRSAAMRVREGDKDGIGKGGLGMRREEYTHRAIAVRCRGDVDVGFGDEHVRCCLTKIAAR